MQKTRGWCPRVSIAYIRLTGALTGKTLESNNWRRAGQISIDKFKIQRIKSMNSHGIEKFRPAPEFIAVPRSTEFSKFSN